MFRFVFYDNSVVEIAKISNPVRGEYEITDVNKVGQGALKVGF
jgi:dTDP-glucose pyrophosphorylase